MIKYVLYYFNNPDIASKYSIIRNFKNKYLLPKSRYCIFWEMKLHKCLKNKETHFNWSV